MRTLAFALAVATSMTATVAVGLSPAEAKTPLRITVGEYSTKTGPYFQEVKQAFEKQYPDVDVQVEVVSWDNLQQKLTTDISGGDNADLSIIGTRWLLDFVSQDTVAALDSYVTDEFRGRFIGTFLNPSVIKGKTWGLPIAASARAMYYNKSILDKAGVTTPPKTWDEVLSACAKIKHAYPTDTYCFGLQGKEIETDIYFYYALWTYGGDLVTADKKSGLDTEAGIKAATLYKTMIDKGYSEPSVTAYNREDVQNQFKQGKIGMMITAPWLIGQIKTEAPKLDYGIAPIPEGTRAATYGVTDSIVMFENSKHKKEAWDFLNFVFQTPWRVKFDTNEGFLPVNKEEAALPQFADDPQMKAFTALLPVAKFAPLLTGWEEAAAAVIRNLQQMYLGQAKPEDAMKTGAEQVNAAINK
jgi:multiple sugar transport system substrate-binding protein